MLSFNFGDSNTKQKSLTPPPPPPPNIARAGAGAALRGAAEARRGDGLCDFVFFRKEMLSFSTSSSLAASIFPVANVLRLQASSLSERSRDTETFSRAVRHAPEGREARRAQGEGVHSC